jgi:DNA-binding MarR family transcriptional regulator
MVDVTERGGSGGGPLATCACFNARSAARVISDLYDRTLAPTGLKLSQFAILATIRQRHRATMQELAAELGLDPSTMTRTLRPLEEAGLVRTQPGGDRRAKALELTPEGDGALTRAFERWSEAQRTLRQRIGDEVFERLSSDLAAVTQALRA